MDHAKEEYEYQHFHFSVRQFKEESNNIFLVMFSNYSYFLFKYFLDRLFIKTTVGNVVGKLLAAILEKLGKNQSPESFEKIKKAIRNNILRESEDILKQFDDKITETFSIPNNALLPEDYLQKYKYTTEDEKNIQDTYNELKNRYSHVSPAHIFCV